MYHIVSYLWVSSQMFPKVDSQVLAGLFLNYFYFPPKQLSLNLAIIDFPYHLLTFYVYQKSISLLPEEFLILWDGNGFRFLVLQICFLGVCSKQFIDSFIVYFSPVLLPGKAYLN